MLIDHKGRNVSNTILPNNRKAREAFLAPLREVLVPRPAKGAMFKLQERARLKK